MFSVILYMLRQTVDNRAPPLLFPSFFPLTVTFPKLAVILLPLYISAMYSNYAVLSCDFKSQVDRQMITADLHQADVSHSFPAS
jgi:hypothetical protein